MCLAGVSAFRIASLVSTASAVTDSAASLQGEQFNKRGIRYVPSERNKSEIYRDFLPLLNSGRVVLPRNDRLIRQLCLLERTTSRGSGRDSIDHPTDPA